MTTLAPVRYDIGLSPPTRGNRAATSWSAASTRSIPAHAGEPVGIAGAQAVFEVYPRPRGGTARMRACFPSRAGLSPPTRGNLTSDGVV